MKDPQSALFSGQVTNGLDSTTELLVVGNYGFARAVTSSSGFLDSAGGITAAISAVVITIACCWAICSRMSAGSGQAGSSRRKPKKRRSKKATYARVEADDDSDDSDNDDFIIEQEAKLFERA